MARHTANDDDNSTPPTSQPIQNSVRKRKRNIANEIPAEIQPNLKRKQIPYQTSTQTLKVGRYPSHTKRINEAVDTKTANYLKKPVVPQQQLFALAGSKLLSKEKKRTLVGTSRTQATSATQENVLDWVKSDNRRMLHVVYRVGDLDRTIKFYTECLGMKLLRKRDIPEEKYTNAFLDYGPEDSHSMNNPDEYCKGNTSKSTYY